MADNQIIFLNGAASSGKAKIAAALQHILEEPYYYFSVDSLLHHIPERYMSTAGEDIDQSDQEELLKLFPRLMSGIHHCIRSFARQDINLIVDHVIQSQDWLDECVDLLAGYPVLFAGVRCELDELERREQEDQRVEGLARIQYEIVYAHDQYDVEVNSCAEDLHECAEKIKIALQIPKSERVFARLHQQRSSASAG